MAISIYDNPAQQQLIPLPFNELLGAVQAKQANYDSIRKPYETLYDKAYNLPSLPGPDTEYKKTYLKDMESFFDKNIKGKDLTSTETSNVVNNFVRSKVRDEGIRGVVSRYSKDLEARKNIETLIKEGKDNPANYYQYLANKNKYISSTQFDPLADFGSIEFPGNVDYRKELTDMAGKIKPNEYKYDSFKGNWLETNSGKQLTANDIESRLSSYGLDTRAIEQIKRDAIYDNLPNIQKMMAITGETFQTVTNRFIADKYNSTLEGVANIYKVDNREESIKPNPYELATHKHNMSQLGVEDAGPQTSYSEGLSNNNLDKDLLTGTPASGIKFKDGKPVFEARSIVARAAGTPNPFMFGARDNDLNIVKSTEKELKDKKDAFSQWSDSIRQNNPALSNLNDEELTNAYKEAVQGHSKMASVKQVLGNSESDYFTKQILGTDKKLGDILGRTTYVSDSRGNPLTDGTLTSTLKELGYGEKEFTDAVKVAKITSIAPINGAIPGAFQVTLLDSNKKPRNILIDPNLEQKQAFSDVFAASQLESKGQTGEMIFQGSDGNYYVADTQIKKSEGKYGLTTKIYGAAMKQGANGELEPAKGPDGSYIRDTRFQTSVPELARMSMAKWHNSPEMKGKRETFKKNEIMYDTNTSEE